MTKKEQEILELYLEDLRKKRVIIIFVVILIVIIGCIFMKKYLLSDNENVMSENSIQDNMINDISNETLDENTISKNEKTKEENQIQSEDSKIEETEIKIQTEEVKVETNQKENKDSNNQPNEMPIEQKSSKPANKDFLFTDGYNMENVTQAAQEYLLSTDYPGECVPIQDSEGVYLGLRVIFY